jgi:hypothetical protein
MAVMGALSYAFIIPELRIIDWDNNKAAVANTGS